jgi:monothiol glutaredoxin
MDVNIKEKCEKMIGSHKIVLFMKGNRKQPNCGFSSRVVGMLEELEVDYQTFNVLYDSGRTDEWGQNDPDIRGGMKEFSSWPTFPQLYVDQDFVGGCDIITELNQSGELAQLLGVTLEEVSLPKIECSEAMINVLKASLQKHDGGVHLEISKDFQYDIGIGPKQPGNFEVVVQGVPFYLSRGSAKRADGLKLDYDSRPEGGVLIDNPNEPQVGDLSVVDLKKWLDEGKDLAIFDVRGEDERAISKLAEAKPFDAEGQAFFATLAKDSTIVFQCRSGGRSMQAARHFALQGYTNVHNLVGGINAWSAQIDSSIPQY